MKLDKKQIDKFRKLYQQRFGVELTPEEALEQATILIEFVQSVLMNPRDGPPNTSP